MARHAQEYILKNVIDILRVLNTAQKILMERRSKLTICCFRCHMINILAAPTFARIARLKEPVQVLRKRVARTPLFLCLCISAGG